MIVSGMSWNDDYSQTLFTGSDDDCEKYVSTLDLSNYHRLSLCKDNGLIERTIVATDCSGRRVYDRI